MLTKPVHIATGWQTVSHSFPLGHRPVHPRPNGLHNVFADVLEALSHGVERAVKRKALKLALPGGVPADHVERRPLARLEPVVDLFGGPEVGRVVPGRGIHDEPAVSLRLRGASRDHHAGHRRARLWPPGVPQHRGHVGERAAHDDADPPALPGCSADGGEHELVPPRGVHLRLLRQVIAMVELEREDLILRGALVADRCSALGLQLPGCAQGQPGAHGCPVAAGHQRDVADEAQALHRNGHAHRLLLVEIPPELSEHHHVHRHFAVVADRARGRRAQLPQVLASK
mmetsp:Transcript_66832/g.189607  ORF Transcript_66832/g.189607 Transcript_66832/m.189607 type:complete len:286 (-) Transcript_66832:369-1226(-)